MADEDKKIGYEDMLTMEAPVSRRGHMSMYQRSAQFMPFAALTGLDEIYDETERQHMLKVMLDNNMKL
ncbi:MAG: hypothetical protein BWY61_01676 [Firmicutes bacterium ADurb.Bin354]|nr:MAG: hypothetical protein BWY61_01676 [Firmicutes bacterium ADurb.Bin354]